MDSLWVNYGVFLDRLTALNRQAGRPREVQALPELHTGPIESE